MHISPSMRSCAIRLVPCVLAMAGVTHLAIAGIENGGFIHGSGNISFNAATQTFTITSSDVAIIEYASFNIATNQIVNFDQPNPTSRVLNRVVSNDPTIINGMLNANGIVYLTNSAGIVFGKGAVINTAQFYAAAGEMQDSDFLNGIDLFTNLSGNVVNMGTVRAEDAIHFIGRRIVNEGMIDVTGMGGIVTLTATDDSVHIAGPASHYMVTIASSNTSQGGVGVDHASTGAIQTADGGRIRLGAGDIFSMAVQVAGSGINGSNVNFDSPTYIDHYAEIHGDTAFASTVDTARRSPAATLIVKGDAVFDGGVGTIDRLQSIEVFGDSTMNGGLVLTDGHQEYRAKMTLLSDAKLASFFAGDISVSGEIDGPHALLIETDGTIFLFSPVGNNDALERLILNGDGKAVLSGNIITTKNDQRYFVDVELADHMDMFSANGKILLTKTVEGGGFDLTLDAPESHIQGKVSNVHLLTTRGSGATHIGADIAVLDGMRFENAVKLTDSVSLSNVGSGEIAFLSTIDGEHALLMTSTNGNARFGGNVGETNPLASLETIVNGTIYFGADLVQTVGDILLNEQVSLIAVPAIATMGAEGDITFISASGDFVMGHKQKLTTLGDLMINAANGTAKVGDLNAYGDMFVHANAILLLARDASDVMLPDGTMVMDTGLDFVATGTFNFSVAPVVIGSGPAPRFVSAIENADATGTLSAFDVVVADEPLTESLFRILPETYLDPFVAARGPEDPGPGTPPQPPSDDPPAAEVNLATALGGAADDVDETEIKDSLNIDPVERIGLAIMGVRVREVSRDALTGYVDGRAVYEDLQTPSLNGNGNQQPIVSINRIHRVQLRRTLQQLDRQLLLIEHDQETGKLTSVQDRDEDIRAILARSWKQFSDDARITDAPAFAAFVRERDAELANVFAALQQLPRELAVMGLSAREANQALVSVLERLASDIDGLNIEVLHDLILRTTWQPA